MASTKPRIATEIHEGYAKCEINFCVIPCFSVAIMISLRNEPGCVMNNVRLVVFAHGRHVYRTDTKFAGGRRLPVRRGVRRLDQPVNACGQRLVIHGGVPAQYV